MKRDKQSFLFHTFRKVAVQLTTKSLTIDFFLVCQWIIKPFLIGRGGSFALEWRKRESPNFRLVLTALNRISWERFTAMAWVFPETCWCCDVPSKIRLTRWISSFGTDAICFCCERSPSNTWSELKRWWRMVLAALLKIIPSSKDEVVDASNVTWPTCSSKVKRTSFPFFFSYKQLTYFIIDFFNLVLCTFLINSSLAPRFSRISLYVFTKAQTLVTFLSTIKHLQLFQLFPTTPNLRSNVC